MPRNKDLKRLVRARMTKTGEAYTAALANIKGKPRAASVAAPADTTPPRAPTAPAVSPADYAAVAGRSDAIIKAQTGCTWERWVNALDRHGAARMSHGEIASLVSGKYRIDDWWSHAVAVGYERIKGLRARGQRRDGSFEASKSRTFNVPVTTLFPAWSDARIRRQWLNDAGITVRTATAPRTMRIGLADRSIVAVGFTAKGGSKSSVTVQHTKLPDRATADRLRQYWSDRLDALRDVLAESRSSKAGT